MNEQSDTAVRRATRPYSAAEPTPLKLGGAVVAEYVTEPRVPTDRGPRPFLHPVRTLGGTVVTDVLPEDHPHHLGVSVCMQDVNGTNLWGGRTYVRGDGYTWLDDHARITHEDWRRRDDDRIEALLRWHGRDGGTLLDEERTMAATPVDDTAWLLDFTYTLTNPGPERVTLGSPTTNGRPDNAGYGGFFWRVAPGPEASAFTATTDVEDDVNGSAEPWVAFRNTNLGGQRYTLVFEGLGDGDRWFVRTSDFPGVCVALAFTDVRHIEPGASLGRRHRVIVADGAWSPERVHAAVRALEA